MATDTEQRSHVGFRGPSAFPILKKQVIPLQHSNQLQFNINTPYSIESLASNVKRPQPMVIEKIPPVLEVPQMRVIPHIHGMSMPSSPASSISSERLHLAVQLAKMDARKLKEQREAEQQQEHQKDIKDMKMDVAQNKRTKYKPQVYGARKVTQNTRKDIGHSGKILAAKAQNKNQMERAVRRDLHEYHFYPEHVNSSSDDKQTREIRRLEKQIQIYLERLDELIRKGQEVIQKKDRRLQRNHRDDVSHLSDEDTDPRQFERAEEQATRSARVLYMIERQIRELDDELRRKGRNMRQPKKGQTLSRLAAAQRATVRALQMLINSAPLQPKGSQHYPSIYRELTSLIQQLSMLQMQLEGRGGEMSLDIIRQKTRNDLEKPYQRQAVFKDEMEPRTFKEEGTNKPAFAQEPVKKIFSAKSAPSVKELLPDESCLTVEPTPERSATLKAGLQALLRVKQHEQKRSIPFNSTNTKKKAVLFPPSLQAKRRKAQQTAAKSVKPFNEAANFTKETTASRLKKVEKQKTLGKDGNKEMPDETGKHHHPTTATKSVGTSPGDLPKNGIRLNERLQEKEVQRQVWLEEESKRKLREMMEIPKHLVSEAEEAIKMKLRPLLDQAQAVVESSKTKPVQERFADLAANVTMKESDKLSEMILDDLLADTAEEFQRLENDEDSEMQTQYLQNCSTLENLLQRLEQFEEEEDNIRRRLHHVSYSNPGDNRPRPKPHSETYLRKDGRRESPSPMVIHSARLVTEKGPPAEYNNDDEKRILRFTNDKTDTFPAKDYVHPSSGHKQVDYTRTPALTRPVEKHPLPLLLPSKVRENIFTYREKYSRYLEQTSMQHHGTFDPWKVVERLSDEIFDEILGDVAAEFAGACDEVTELIFKSEFMKE